MQKLLAEKSKQLEEKNKRLKDIVHISEGFYIIIRPVLFRCTAALVQ